MEVEKENLCFVQGVGKRKIGVGKEVFSAWFTLNLGFFSNNSSSSMLFPLISIA